MDPPGADPPAPDHPRISEAFLQFCIKFEYFKRKSALDAHLNVCGMLDSTLAKDPNTQFPDLKPEFQEYPDDKPPPKKRPKKSKPAEYSPVVPDYPDWDSDDSDMGYPEDPEETVKPGQRCTLKKAKWLYARWGKMEFDEYKNMNKVIPMEKILDVLFIQKVTRTARKLKFIFPVIDTMKVTTGYRQLSIELDSFHDSVKIGYMSHENGCLIWYGDAVKLQRNFKYQSAGALDFFYLVSDESARFTMLEFDIQDYGIGTPPIWPFKSFYRKIRGYLGRLNYLDIEGLTMKVFYDEGSAVKGREILATVWSHILPEAFEYLKIRVWDASKVAEKYGMPDYDQEELFEKLYKTPQWGSIKTLDIFDVKIFLEDDNYEYLHDFETIYYPMDSYDFRLFLSSFGDEQRLHEVHTCTLYVDRDFNFLHARQSLRKEPRSGEIHDRDNGIEWTWSSAVLENEIVTVIIDKLNFRLIFKMDHEFKTPKLPMPKSGFSDSDLVIDD